MASADEAVGVGTRGSLAGARVMRAEDVEVSA